MSPRREKRGREHRDQFNGVSPSQDQILGRKEQFSSGSPYGQGHVAVCRKMSWEAHLSQRLSDAVRSVFIGILVAGATCASLRLSVVADVQTRPPFILLAMPVSREFTAWHLVCGWSEEVARSALPLPCPGRG